MTEGYRIRSSPYGDVAEAVAACPKAITAWYVADHSGSRLAATAPTSLTGATHMWGWGNGCWVRLRIRRDDVLLSVLEVVTASDQLAVRTPVTVTRVDSAPIIDSGHGMSPVGKGARITTLVARVGTGRATFHEVVSA